MHSSVLQHLAKIVLCTAALGTAHAATGVQGSLTRAIEVKAGQALQIPISLTNPGDQAETVRIRLQDMQVLPTGTTYSAAGHQERSNALWAKLPASTITVPAHSSKTFNIVVTVPQNAAPGAHWSALIVEPDRLPSTSTRQGTVVINTRYAVNLITTLAGGVPKVRIASPNLQRKADGVNLGVQFFNDGTASTVPQFRAEVYDTQGKLVTRTDVAPKRLYPQGGAKVEFNFGKLPAGKYTFVVMANDGVTPVVGTRYTVNVED